MRKEYEMFFAEGGIEALDIMNSEDIDVVVSDMRMPGMDGAQLLAEIQERHPHTIRIMLTGQADEESVMRTVGVVHQFLAKPCDPDKLKSILQKSSALQNLLSDGRLKGIVSKIGSLPSLPSSFSELQNAIANPEVSIERVAEIVEKDVAMCTKVLQLVNSSFFGLFATVDTPARAVSLLGLDTIKALVLGVGIFSQVKIPKTLLSAESLFDHCLLVGQLAKKIAGMESDDKLLISDSFLAGIIHDIGKLIFLSHLPEQYEKVITSASDGNASLENVEQEVIGSCHADIGAYLAGLWGFNSTIVEAVGFAHQLDCYPANGFSPAMAVHVADCMYYKHRPEEQIGTLRQIDKATINALSFEEKIPLWEEACAEVLDSVDQ